MSSEQTKLANIRIVLVNTSHPGNIGAVARAMKTMCLYKLVLVEPKLFPNAEATSRASGADDVLANATVVETLDQALTGCRLVVGASARMRRLSWPLLNPRQCAEKIISETDSGDDIAVVFGREHSGLSNDELERCHFLVNIPSNSEYSSLNLASAVQVVSYELLVAAQNQAAKNEDGGKLPSMDEGESEQLASADQLDSYYQHLEVVLTEIGFLNPQHPRKMMRRLKRLFNRARMSVVEINILRGVLSGVQSYGNKTIKKGDEENRRTEGG